MSQISLFSSFSVSAHWEAFDQWLANMEAGGHIKQESSAAVYRDMWGSFVTWCAEQLPPVTLATITPADVHAFQQSRIGMQEHLSLSPRHASRLLRLIDRVLRHWSGEEETPPNMAAHEAIEAQPAVRYANAANHDTLPLALETTDARQLITFLSKARPRLGATAESLSWQVLRNRVSVSLQLGAGLTPGDLRFLTLDSPVSAGGRVKGRPWKLHVPGNGSAPPREAPVASWSGELLKYWIEIRKEQQIKGVWLFPSTRTGKQWGKEAQYKAAKQVLEDSGLPAQGLSEFLCSRASKTCPRRRASLATNARRGGQVGATS